MQLSKRLQAVAGMAAYGNRLADVGTDHGYIPIYLVEQKRIPGAIAMDIKSGPLERARTNIQAHGLEAYIETRLSDGTAALYEGEADTLIIAGMGGGLIRKIMAEGESLIRTMKEYILQPQSEIEEVRRFLQEHGYMITDENMITDEGKYYPVLHVIRGEMDDQSEIDFKFGKILLTRKDQVLLSYLKKKEEGYNVIIRGLSGNKRPEARIRTEELNHELTWVREAISCYY